LQSVGTGALGRHGDFWYPVRLIQATDKSQTSWTVRWWRGCLFATPGLEPDSITTLEIRDIVDSLWMDRTARRQVRLGMWQHACNVPRSEDILNDPSTIPYTPDIERALSPHRGTLQRLLLNPETVDNTACPAKAWLIQRRKCLLTTIVPHTGSLSVSDRARVANYFDLHICGDPKLRHMWIAFLSIAHAHTLLIASRLASDGDHLDCSESDLLEKAWHVQCFEGSDLLMDVDVDRESLEHLEELMFERSREAGIAGYYQWGLDAGDHQEQWDPWGGLPTDLNHEDRTDSESELVCGNNFIKVTRSVPLEKEKQPRPKPVPKGRRRK
ncbi:hypothetical protein DXG01_009991, partial [Tephrocybe rancida]